ncbi:acyclic terpene utilization AtuA family protein [Pseudoroseicyclus tamaricis]|uniref:DUF1446 domain-containing protein n=1 Tax=Pseudoroseicyclus tamaricis TaxID=2705421 RepID=A0A6B2JXF4_9RHOB|nr:acyclic terpene utilization AtuA family protein [Pseudoroseicyclus tamaricis]NDV00032.1 DUF1446 domain-containing protein [Pseudoroseicyclus tamaricis]
MGETPFIIGSGAGFSGDRIDAAQPVVAAMAAMGQGGALIFETMGERTLALGQVARAADPQAGYDPYLPQYLGPILKPALDAGIRIVGNFGCANPEGAARLIAAMAKERGLTPRIAVVTGDDLLGSPALDDAVAWDGDGTLAQPSGEPVAVNVYIGAAPIAEALKAGADIVVTGRIADPALALGPLVAHFGWDFDDLDRIAAGTLVGHLLECGSQVSGGYFADPGVKDVPNLADVGFPLAEVSADGSFVVTKPAGTGGRVDRMTVLEQMLYEIHDPAAYLTPDVALDLTQATITEVGENRVAVAGARGHAAPQRLKATVSYRGEWLGEAEISYAGPNARARAELAAEVIRTRVSRAPEPPRMRADILGTVSVFDDDGGSLRAADRGPADGEYRVRFAFGGSETAVRAANHEVNALYCCGPAGGGGVRISAVPRFVTRSVLVRREAVRPHVAFYGEEVPA